MKAASLTSSLLAVKGNARPTLSREAVSPYSPPHSEGYRLRPVGKVAPSTRGTQAEKVSVCDIHAKPTAKIKGRAIETLEPSVSVKNKDKRFHNSVHLGAEAHKMLRMLAARSECSLQMIMEQAVTRYLNEESGGIACICKLEKKD